MKLRKVLSMTLIFLLVLSSVAMAAPSKTVPGQKDYSIKRVQLGKKLLEDPKTANLSDDAVVRIIVELNDKPVIEYATEKGINFTSLDSSVVKKVTDEIINTQDIVKSDIKSKNINIKYHNNFTNVVNGFSGTTTLGEAKKIEKLLNVKRVVIANEYERPEPDMNTSKDIVKAIETWTELGYNGEGMLVAIVDTGIDPTHKDMVLTHPELGKLNPTEVSNFVSNGLPGKWRTSKVPYGYNYMDNNQEILDLGPDASMHGMHVAGTVGANGDETGIKGVAPEAQLLAMKVFGNDPGMPSTFGDVIIRAIDDSIVLGADVINMSLGSTASFVMPDDPEQMAVTRAVENGVFCAISAGNSDRFGSEWNDPYAKNPDIGVVGSPGLTSESLQVASIENTNIKASALEVNEQLMGYFAAGPFNPISVFNTPMEYVYCGLGGEQADFDGKDLTGKIALIQRGEFAFVDKILNAQNNGAAGVIVFNDEARGDALVSMQYPTLVDDGQAGEIPALFIGHTDGNTLLALLEDEVEGNEAIEFNGAETIVANPNSGHMSDFTSWGTTPSLDFKPEITAPGGQIYSTANNDEYQIMSGTSMASPHVAGGAALVLQRVDELFPTLEGKDRVEMAKNLLMSTANPLTDKGYWNGTLRDGYGVELGNYTSPRRHGAGVMNLYAAGSTPAIVTYKDTALSKVNLKEIGDTTTFTLTVSNFSNSPVTYDVNGTVGTDFYDEGFNGLETQGVFIDGTISEELPWLGQYPISFTEQGNSTTISTIQVPANSSVDFDVTIDLTNAIDWWNNEPLTDLFENGTFIEGFVTLTDSTDTNPELSIPYMGFYGEWDQAPIIDDSNYNEDGMQFYGYTVMMDEGTYFLGDTGEGYDDSKIAFSPNSDGWRDAAQPLVSFLRNAKEVDINILNDQDVKIRDLFNGSDYRKNYYDGGLGDPYFFTEDWIWDGTANNEYVEDGQYYYEIKAKIDFEGAQWQTFKFPVKVDTVLPTIEDIQFNADTKEITVTANDDYSTVDQVILLDSSFGLVDNNSEGVFDLSSFDKGDYNFFIAVDDFAGNETVVQYSVTIPSEEPDSDDTIPYIFMDSPTAFGTYNVNTIEVYGGVEDASDIVKVQINGSDVPFEYDPQVGQYLFETTLNYENGMHQIDVTAEDSKGNLINFERKIFVDSELPIIGVPDASGIVESTVDSINLAGTISDNFPDLKVKVNGNMLTNIQKDWSYFTDLAPASYDLDMDIPLNYGDNTIVIEASDSAGNISVTSMDIHRLQEGEGEFTFNVDINNPEELVSSDRQLQAQFTSDSDVTFDWTILGPNNTIEDSGNGSLLANDTFDFTWAPEESKKLNGEYKLVVDVTKDGYTATYTKTFEVYNYPILVNDINVIKQNGYVSVEAEIENLGPNSENPMLVVQVTDSEGYVVNISTVSMSGLLENQVISLSSGFGLTEPGKYTVDVYVWTGWDNTEALSSPETTTFNIN